MNITTFFIEWIVYVEITVDAMTCKETEILIFFSLTDFFLFQAAEIFSGAEKEVLNMH